MVIQKIQQELFRLQDKKYRDFQMKLIPTVDPETVIGVRTPALRSYAKELIKQDKPGANNASGMNNTSKTGIGPGADIGQVADIPPGMAEPGMAEPGMAEEFINALPHEYFDENQLHAFILSELKDYEKCIAEVERFLPYIDNWATCDQLSPKVFKKNRHKLLEEIKKWIESEETYTVRFAVGMLMQHYLNEDFDGAYPKMVASLRSEEYYVNMMIAWYFATALAKQYDAVLPYIEEQRLPVWTHNKAIQKAVESRRITPEKKEYLRSLKK